MNKNRIRNGKRQKLIFRRWRTVGKGKKRLYAPTYGLKAWPIWVDV